MFTLVKRVGEKDENLTVLLYSLLLSTNTITAIFPAKFLIAPGTFTEYPKSVSVKFFLALIFFIWYFICKKYFINKKHYDRIIIHYEKKYSSKSKQFALLGILYFAITVTTFLFLAIVLSRK
jgi:hypothetical protein